MSRRTLLCEKLTGDTRSLIWTDSRGPGYWAGTILAKQAQHPGLTCSRKRTLFPSIVLAAVITVRDKYLSFVGIWIRIMVHGGQGQLAGRPRTTPMQYPWRGAASLARHGYRVPAEQIIQYCGNSSSYIIYL